MFEKNTTLDYSLLLILSMGKKSFSALGRILRKSDDTVRRLLSSSEENFSLMHNIASETFKNKKKLVCSIDDTLLRKLYALSIEGVCDFFDSKTGKMIPAYKALLAGLTDGIFFVPLHSAFLYSKEILSNATELKDELIRKIIKDTLKSFPDKIITFALDGAFATKKLFFWAKENDIRLETRMHSNRKVTYNGKIQKISEIKELQPKGRHMARTIEVLWYDIILYITAQRRIDKHGEESIVYQASTYKASPDEHVQNYKKRWPVEKFIRTSKQHLGLQDCFSTKLETQTDHLSSVLLSYAIVQVEMKKKKFLTPEDTIRSLRAQNFDFLRKRFYAADEIFVGIDA